MYSTVPSAGAALRKNSTRVWARFGSLFQPNTKYVSLKNTKPFVVYSSTGISAVKVGFRVDATTNDG